jgi:hypothetical protein
MDTIWAPEHLQAFGIALAQGVCVSVFAGVLWCLSAMVGSFGKRGAPKLAPVVVRPIQAVRPRSSSLHGQGWR